MNILLALTLCEPYIGCKGFVKEQGNIRDSSETHSTIARSLLGTVYRSRSWGGYFKIEKLLKTNCQNKFL
ncbi:MAG: hypothetical protein WKF68_06280 [Daejeonella sp.]